MKYVVWIVIAFAGYTGWIFLGGTSQRSEIAHTVEGVLEGIPHYTADEVIRTRIVRNGKVNALELTADEIFISREEREGERIIRVSVSHPVMVSYLGSERTVGGDIEVTRVVPVNEAAESQRLDRIERDEDQKRRARAKADRFMSKVRDAWSECEEKFGNGNCEMTKPPSGTRDGEVIKDWDR